MPKHLITRRLFWQYPPPQNELRCIFVRRDVARLNACVVIHAKVLPGPVHTWYLSFLDAQAYLALSPVRPSVSLSVTLSDFHSVSPHKASRGHYGGRHGGGHGGRHGRQYGSRQKKLPDIELDMEAGEKEKKTLADNKKKSTSTSLLINKSIFRHASVSSTYPGTCNRHDPHIAAMFRP